MNLLSNPWIISLFTFFAGLVVGIFIYKSKYSDDSHYQQAQDELDELKDEFASYKQSVSSHFSKTSELVNNLTEDYVKVYKHLADGSQTLGNADQLALKLSQDDHQLASVINKIEKNVEAEADDVEPPRDYAAKSDSQGMLSEAFSIGANKQPKQPLEEAPR